MIVNIDNMKKVHYFSMAILLLITILLLLILIKVPYTVYVTYYNNEPNNKQNCHLEQIKWSRDKCQIYSNFGPVEFQNYYAKCVVYNNDNEGGIFEFNVVTRDSKGNERFNDYSFNNYSQYIGAFSKVEFELNLGSRCDIAGEVNGECQEIDYSLTELRVYPPIKEVCEDSIQYSEIKKTREEIKYCSAWKKIIGICKDISIVEA